MNEEVALKIGDVVRLKDATDGPEYFIAPGTVIGFGRDDEDFITVRDANGVMHSGWLRCRFIPYIADKYIVEGISEIFLTYEDAELSARAEAAHFGETTAIAKVVAYAKPTTGITVEMV